MMDWLVDTLVWTAALIALVLVLRRPVAKHFGPQMAYALWALPVARLFLPPIELPAWMAPSQSLPAGPAIADEAGSAFYVVEYGPATEAAAPSLLDTLPLAEILLVAWLTGFAAFLFVRFRNYARMRELMLDGSVEVGRSGKVRLVETRATNAPLAFGVRDKVVALPEGFMAQHDRGLRDLALAHELAHHRGHDILANFMAQPLFALHWFNPLGRVGWLAMRRDQEAACDARVVQSRAPEERAASATLGPAAKLAITLA